MNSKQPSSENINMISMYVHMQAIRIIYLYSDFVAT